MRPNVVNVVNVMNVVMCNSESFSVLNAVQHATTHVGVEQIHEQD